MTFFKNQKTRIIVWASLAGIISLLAVFLVGLSWANAGKIPYGLSIANLKIGGLGDNQAQKILTDRINDFTQKKLTFTFQSKTWQMTPQELGLQFNVEQTLADASSFGHQSNLLAGITGQVQALVSQTNLPLSFTVNSQKLQSATAVLTAVETPAENAAFKYNSQNNSFEIIPDKSGSTINRYQLISDVVANFNQTSSQPISLVLVESQPPLTQDNLTGLIPEAQKIIDNAPYFLQSPEATWKIEKAELASWLDAAPPPDDSSPIKIALKESEIQDFLLPLTSAINREPINAQLTAEGDEIKFVVLAQKGQRLNIPKSVAAIQEKILAGEKNIALIIDSVEPKIDNTNLGSLGVVKLLGRGESNFSGSTTNRKKNIAVGTAKLNGLLIKSGETFSFVQNIGEIDAANGWVEGYVLKNNQTLTEYGGGICQVSTTLFRAAINSGLKVVERQAHAIPLHYYDPPGFDATIYPPRPDFKFLNDTPGSVLLQGRISGNKLIFEIYGQSDGRQVKVIGPKVIYKSPEGALKTTLTQEIWRNGALERSDVFKSNYKPVDSYPIVSPSPSPSPSP